MLCVVAAHGESVVARQQKARPLCGRDQGVAYGLPFRALLCNACIGITLRGPVIVATTACMLDIDRCASPGRAMLWCGTGTAATLLQQRLDAAEAELAQAQLAAAQKLRALQATSDAQAAELAVARQAAEQAAAQARHKAAKLDEVSWRGRVGWYSQLYCQISGSPGSCAAVSTCQSAWQVSGVNCALCPGNGSTGIISAQ